MIFLLLLIVHSRKILKRLYWTYIGLCLRLRHNKGTRLFRFEHGIVQEKNRLHHKNSRRHLLPKYFIPSLRSHSQFCRKVHVAFINFIVKIYSYFHCSCPSVIHPCVTIVLRPTLYNYPQIYIGPKC